MIAKVTSVRKGDIVRFKSYALRVEAEPESCGSFIKLTGRSSVDGSPIVTKKFNSSLDVNVAREA